MPPRWCPPSAVTTPGPKGTIMETLLVLAIILVVGLVLYRFLRARTAH